MRAFLKELVREWWVPAGQVLKRYIDFALPVVPALLLVFLCGFSGGFWPYFGGLAAGIAFWYLAFRCLWIQDRTMKDIVKFSISWIIFGYTCAGLGFVLGTWGVGWALPATLFLVPFYIAYLMSLGGDA